MPEPPRLPGFAATRTDNSRLLNQLSGLDVSELGDRIRSGNVPYVAFLKDELVAYGWSAWRRAAIGELEIEFEIPAGNRYLWDFVTLPAQRGKGIYTRLLQEIVTVESALAGRFWIGHDLENRASGKGLTKAGFQVAGEVWMCAHQPIFVGRSRLDRAEAGASLLQIPSCTDPSLAAGLPDLR